MRRENDAYPPLDMAAMKRNESNVYPRDSGTLLSSTNTIWIKDALGSGYDGVVMMGCKKAQIISAILSKARKWRMLGWQKSATPCGKRMNR